MTIKINIGVNKKVGLPDYGSAGGHCNIEIEADNSILDHAEQFLQRVKDAYEMARLSVEEELAHHQPGNTTSNGASQSRSYCQPDKEPAQQKQEYRQDYRSENSRSDNSTGGHRVASDKQQRFIAALVKGVKGLDWRTLDRYCSVQFGKNMSQLTPKEASALIDDLKEAKESRKVIAA